jgi:hypothetical protein
MIVTIWGNVPFFLIEGFDAQHPIGQNPFEMDCAKRFRAESDWHLGAGNL